MTSTTRRIPETAWAHEMSALGYRAAAAGAVEFESADGSIVVEILERRRASIRDLRAALTQLAVHVADHEHVRCACLLVAVERLTQDRLRREWAALLSVLRPAVARRLALVAVADAFSVCLPKDSATLAALAGAGRRVLAAPTARDLPRTPKPVVVLKVLLSRRLSGAGPISRRELGAQAGCSYPTIAKAVDGLGRSVRQLSNRSVEFGQFPQEAWNGLLARAPSQRPADAEGLLRRLQRLNPPGVALGGVVAAHHWDPHFDLRGLPRLDLSVETAGGLDLGFVQRLDPALRATTVDDGAPVLVVHPIQRRVALSVPNPDGSLPIADPVETLLDLNELRLVEQAESLIEHLERTRTAGDA